MNFCENRAADSVVGYYCALAKREGIPFRARLDLPDRCFLSTRSICVWCCLICWKMRWKPAFAPHPPGGKIEITAYVHAERLLLIEVENAFDGEFTKKAGCSALPSEGKTGSASSPSAILQKKTAGKHVYLSERHFLAKVMLCG